MQILTIVAHPDISSSRVNKAMTDLCVSANNITVNEIYKKYPNFEIDVATEQILLESHDRIIFQFPFYWYSSPALLKQYIDSVLTYGWAFGPRNALANKELIVAVSTGSTGESYHAGEKNSFTIDEFLRPFQQTANFLSMKYLPHFLIAGAANISDEEVQYHASKYFDYITAK